ncbi:GNAT family N-acetyltransferase [Streptomyces sp. NPDC006784]|uniref:GNAT family N-acetyltransferase n=1 Tax=Streptomyces sp. NPDC006784 TaxID=3364764 RepID=UPI0036A17BA7
MTTSSTARESAAYTAAVADSAAEVRAAQRLRHEVFGQEMGAAAGSRSSGLERDAFDSVADHLIVTETATGDVVGTYRLLPPGRVRPSYADGEFDLGALAGLRTSMIEAGRSCVHPGHRSGAVINLMWSALARYVLLSGHRYLAGCASVPLADGGRSAAHTWALCAARHAPPSGMEVFPHRPWQPSAPVQVTEPAGARTALLPPLLRGYLRLGAWVCGAPAHDPEFGVADFFVILDMEQLNDRYHRYFLGEPG